MRFAILTTDRYLGIFETFVAAGWQPVKLFTVRETNNTDGYRAVAALAERHGAAIQLDRIAESDLRALRTLGCDALIVACYPWRVRGWEEFIAYAVNFHASPLPEARGPYPIPRAILEGRRTWAITCHRVTPAFDEGAILASEWFPMDADECHESLDLKIQIAGKRLATRLIQDFIGLWEGATPQDQGDYWPRPSMEDRVIEFRKPVDQIMRHIRAFGKTNSLAKIGETWLAVSSAIGWIAPHGFTPGSVVHIHGRTIVIAASDGYIGFTEANLAIPEVAAVLDHRTAH